MANKGNFYKASANKAANSVKSLSRLSYKLGTISTIITGGQFLENPNLENGLNLGVSAASMAFWEIGIIYFIASNSFELTKSNTNFLIENDFNPGNQVIFNRE